jgi:cystine transport system substrate-binding protein
MTTPMPVEERIALWLQGEAPDDVPDRVLDAAFETTRTLPQVPAARIGRLRVGRPALVLAAALLVAVSLIASAVAGALVSRMVAPRHPDQLLERIQSSGVLRVAIGMPSSSVPDDALAAFDTDVAGELARRLGTASATIPTSTALVPSPAWDVALPAVPAWTIDRGAFVASNPYYAWPRAVLVLAQANATSLADIGGEAVCTVAGDSGGSWLLGRYGPPGQSPFPGPEAPSSMIVRDTDAGCFEALRAGTVVAMVTATMTPGDVSATTDVRSVGAVQAEPRSIVVARTGPDPGPLLEALESAVADMRRDGTLARLSTQRFGADLSVAP